jgi:hypothetical protein
MTFLSTKIVTVSLLVLFIATVLLGIGTSAKGAKLVSIEKEIRKLEDENRKLTTELITESSLTELTEETSNLGLVVPSNVVYITKEEALVYAK